METLTRLGDGWMTKNAQDLTRIAIQLAGFDAKELVTEIVRRKGSRDGMVNARTVENAMATVADRYKEGNYDEGKDER